MAGIEFIEITGQDLSEGFQLLETFTQTQSGKHDESHRPVLAAALEVARKLGTSITGQITGQLRKSRRHQNDEAFGVARRRIEERGWTWQEEYQIMCLKRNRIPYLGRAAFLETPLNRPIAIDEFAEFERLLSAYAQEHDKADQARRGYYDKHGVRQGGLIAFVRYFWHVLEPETKFVDGWTMWAICEHLEAVTFGEITRLLINVPPGFCKSMLVDVFWPAWEWGPMDRAHHRFVCFSYAASLT